MINTSEFNKLTTENFKARLAQTGLVTKTDFDTKLQSLYKKITSNKMRHLLVENKVGKVKAFNSSYFSTNCSEADSAQIYLVFQG